MSNVRLTWVLPEVTPRQRPIQHTKIDVRVLGADTWTEQALIPPDVTQELLFSDVSPGDYEYQATVVDVDNVSGPPVEASISVPFDPPGVVSTFIATLE